MASNMMENLQAVVQNTAADSIKMIDVDELHESPDNFFSVTFSNSTGIPEYVRGTEHQRDIFLRT